MSDHYDVIVIGSGPGGASLAHRLAPTGKRILLLERGDYLPRSPANWDSQTVFVDGAYQANETWYGADGRELSSRPALLRRRQFQGLWRGAVSDARARFRRGAPQGRHLAGMAAEIRGIRALLCRGRAAVPCPWPARRGSQRAAFERAFPYPPVSHEPRIQALSDSLREGRPASVSSAARHSAGREGRQADADQHLHPLRRFRRFSLPAQRQGRRAGDLRRSGAEGASEPDAADRRLCVEAGDRSEPAAP